MTVIRLTRMGRKKRPFYRIVVTDSRKRRDGGFKEFLGYYDPINKTQKLDKEKYDKWLAVGAKPSAIVSKISSASQ